MNTTPSTPVSPDKLEKDLATLAPLVRAAFCRVDEPSPRVIRAIHEEAVAYLSARNRRRRLIPLFRTLAAAATLTLLLGGAIQSHFSRLEISHAREVGHLLNLGESHVPATIAEGSSGLAIRLLSIQGLDDEEAFFFTPEEDEVLWL